MHVTRRARGPHDANLHEKIHTLDPMRQQEAGKPGGGRGNRRGILQFLLDARQHKRNAGNGRKGGESFVVDLATV